MPFQRNWMLWSVWSSEATVRNQWSSSAGTKAPVPPLTQLHSSNTFYFLMNTLWLRAAPVKIHPATWRRKHGGFTDCFSFCFREILQRLFQERTDTKLYECWVSIHVCFPVSSVLFFNPQLSCTCAFYHFIYQKVARWLSW